MAFNIGALKLPILKTGSTGAAVGAWQRFLQDLNYPIGGIDNSFGGTTDRVTREFQTKNGLTADGIVGPGSYTKALSQGFIFRVANLTAAVLLDYLNFGPSEVRDLQRSLNTVGRLNPALTADGDFGGRSTKGLAETYKIVDVGFRSRIEQQLTAATKQKLGTDLAAALTTLTEYARRLRVRLSGPQWVRFFPASQSIDDLVSPFRQRVQAFEKALRDAGATIEVTNTFRPPERAYLMHYCVTINNRDISPEAVPLMLGVDIDWVHYTNAASLQAARQMVDTYEIGTNPAALRSRHTQALAIDWIIDWQGNLNIKNGSGRVVSIGSPRTGSDNRRLWEVGASYGVYKLEYDPPHWSVDGY